MFDTAVCFALRRVFQKKRAKPPLIRLEPALKPESISAVALVRRAARTCGPRLASAAGNALAANLSLHREINRINQHDNCTDLLKRIALAVQFPQAFVSAARTFTR